MDVQFLVKPAQVRLHRVVGNEQLRGDGGDGVPSRHQGHHLDFPLRQGVLPPDEVAPEGRLILVVRLLGISQGLFRDRVVRMGRLVSEREG